jgi:hypothetical protein
MFWPTQAFNTYDHDPVGVGLRGLPIGLAIMVGCCIVLVLLTVSRGKIRLLMLGSTTIMTVGKPKFEYFLVVLIANVLTGVACLCFSTPYNMDSK